MTRTDELARQFIDLTDRGEWAAREALTTEDCTLVTPVGVFMGPAAGTAFSRPFTGAFSDAHHHIDLVVADGRAAAVEGVWIGTHTNPLPTPDGDVPATGKVLNLPYTVTVQVRDGLISDVHVYFDQLGFLAQLGLLPVPQTA